MRKFASFSRILFMAAAGVSMTVSQALACGDGAVGEICFFATSYCPGSEPQLGPTVYMPADGRTLPVKGYQHLFSLISYTYGGSGDNFALPDLRSRTVVGVGQGKDSQGADLPNSYTEAQMADTVLTAANLPSHSHTASFHPVMGERTVTVPATGGTLALKDAAVPVNAGAAGSVAPSVSGGQTVYPTNATATSGPSNYLKGLYTASPPSGAATATMPVQGTISGTAPVAATLSLPNLPIGGTVSLGFNPTPTPVVAQIPGMALTACMVVEGAFPIRN